MPQEGGLGQHLDVLERRPGLHRDGRELLGPVKLAGRVHIEYGNRENQASRQAAGPPQETRNDSDGPLAQDMVAGVDRLDQGEKVLRPVAPGGRRDEYKRKSHLIQGCRHRLVQARPAGIDDDCPKLKRSVLSSEPVDQRRNDIGCRSIRRVGDDDDPGSSLWKRLAA
ncbi:MAG: hypothetical protein ACLP7Q_24150 [Isosphaeraceae bacterium]